MKSTILLSGIIVLAAFLRIFSLSTVPPGLSIDEVSIALNSASLVENGTDEYNTSYPLWFQAFGEYKLPVYIYTTAVSIVLFGKNEFAVRFPSALAGVGSVVVFYFLLRTLLGIKYARIPFFGAFFLATSPWHVQFSRVAFEANVALFFFLLFLLLIVLFIKTSNMRFLFLSTLSLGITVYTYNAYRILAPFFVLGSVMLLWGKKKRRAHILGFLLFFLFLSIPIMLFSFSPGGWERFNQTSAFPAHIALFRQIVAFPTIFLRNYLSYFSLPFLFLRGDGIGRHQLPDFGLFPLWQLPFLFIGIAEFLRRKELGLFRFGVFFLLLIIPVPAALSLPSPHTLRSLPLLLPLLCFVVFGIYKIIHQRTVFRFFFVTCFLLLVFLDNTHIYLHYYYHHYPYTSIIDWGGGYKTLALAIKDYYSHPYRHVVIDESLPSASTYIRFYAPDVPFITVPLLWEKPIGWGREPTLFITHTIQPNDTKPSNRLLHTITISNRNQDTFAQFWEM